MASNTDFEGELKQAVKTLDNFLKCSPMASILE